MKIKVGMTRESYPGPGTARRPRQPLNRVLTPLIACAKIEYPIFVPRLRRVCDIDGWCCF